MDYEEFSDWQERYYDGADLPVIEHMQSGSIVLSDFI